MSYNDETSSSADHEIDASTPPADDLHGSEDATLAGYLRTHDRPPAFEGLDGHPYTVSIEVEKTPDLRTPFEGYLVFPRWAANGLGIVGHVETPTLWTGRSSDDVIHAAGDQPLLRVKRLLDEAIERRASQLQEPSDAP